MSFSCLALVIVIPCHLHHSSYHHKRREKMWKASYVLKSEISFIFSEGSSKASYAGNYSSSLIRSELTHSFCALFSSSRARDNRRKTSQKYWKLKRLRFDDDGKRNMKAFDHYSDKLTFERGVGEAFLTSDCLLFPYFLKCF